MKDTKWKHTGPAGGLWLTGLLLLTLAIPGQAQIKDLPDAIDKAGRQRMLTQRMLKAWCLMGMNVQTRKYGRQLKGAVKLFDKQLAELDAYAPNAEVRGDLKRVHKLWAPFKKRILTKPERDAALGLLAPNDRLLGAAHKVVLMLERLSGTQAGHLVNVAGRQRMLSQRTAKFYCYRAWGFHEPEVVQGLDQAQREFADGLNELITASVNTREIQDKLNLAQKQWKVFRRGLRMAEQGGRFIPLIVATTADKLLKLMNDLTALYERLARG